MRSSRFWKYSIRERQARCDKNAHPLPFRPLFLGFWRLSKNIFLKEFICVFSLDFAVRFLVFPFLLLRSPSTFPLPRNRGGCDVFRRWNNPFIQVQTPRYRYVLLGRGSYWIQRIRRHQGVDEIETLRKLWLRSSGLEAVGITGESITLDWPWFELR